MKGIFTFYKCILSFKYTSVSITSFTSHRNPVNYFWNSFMVLEQQVKLWRSGILFLRTCFPLKVDISVDRMLSHLCSSSEQGPGSLPPGRGNHTMASHHPKSPCCILLRGSEPAYAFEVEPQGEATVCCPHSWLSCAPRPGPSVLYKTPLLCYFPWCG